MTINLAPTKEELLRLREVSTGRMPADTIVAGGALVNVFTEEVIAGWGVAMSGGRIASIGPDVLSLAGPDTEIIDAAGDLIMPGLVESHTHTMRISTFNTARLQVALGITTSFLEALEITYPFGIEAFLLCLAEAKAAPGRVFLTVPPLIGFDPDHQARLGHVEDWEALLDLDGVAGVGEVVWGAFLQGHARAAQLVAAALSRGLTVEGHSAGARPASLNALAASGVTSDHEGINSKDALARLRLGFYTMARHGATRLDLEAIAPVWDGSGASVDRLGLVTDGVEPDQYERGESLNWVVAEAVRMGLSLPRAVRMATLTPAQRFGVGRWIGGLGAGMMADLLLVPPDQLLRPRMVLISGRPPREGQVPKVPASMLDSGRLPDHSRTLLEHPGPGRWRAMELVGPLVTREAETDGHDAVVAYMIDRLGGNRAFRGLLVGSGLEAGAVALSSGWESTGIMAVGCSPADMEVAMRRVADMRGGAAVVAGGAVVAEWRAEVGGVLTREPLSVVLEQITAVNGALRELGCRTPNPILTFETLSGASIPYLRMYPGGYFRLKDGAYLGLEW